MKLQHVGEAEIGSVGLESEAHLSGVEFANTLPVACSGCGALSQTVEPESPGYYGMNRRNVKQTPSQQKEAESRIFEEAMSRLSLLDDPSIAQSLPAAELESEIQSDRPALCDRCHNLVYQSKGNSILHPSMDSIREMVEASPHRDNHIYHVMDAADFPLSLIPNLISALRLPRLRTQNRRSKHKQYIRGRTADVSFIITRADLLAPKKEMVDRMMPYLQEVLRDALGRTGKNVRLTNVRCVSSHRGWWIPQVKEEIWRRGGAGWVVGKVNVGKSALFEGVYPKGRTHSSADEAKLREVKERGIGNLPPADVTRAVESIEDLEALANPAGLGKKDLELSEPALDKPNILQRHVGPSKGGKGSGEDLLQALIEEQAGEKAIQSTQQLDVYEEEALIDEEEDEPSLLLPPAQEETQYPHMPIVSSLAGTTAAPIRIPFGNGRGELIDLPGIQRSSMETHVKPEHHSSLIMKRRVVPEQHTIKPGQSLLLGGLIRITPKTDNLIVLAYAFTPIEAHLTATSKAIAIQTGVIEDGLPYTGTVDNIGTENAKQRIKSAGTFALEWDATSRRTGSLTDRTAGKRKVGDLPFIVYSADILIEGVGWVELACQTRSRRKNLVSDALSAHLDDPEQVEAGFPEVEVFSPKGKFIAVRRPMNASITGGPKKVAKHAQKQRPRMSISYKKRMEGGRNSSSRVQGNFE